MIFIIVLLLINFGAISFTSSIQFRFLSIITPDPKTFQKLRPKYYFLQSFYKLEFSGEESEMFQGRGGFAESGHFNQYFYLKKKTEEKKNVGIGFFLLKSGPFFDFQRRAGEDSPFPYTSTQLCAWFYCQVQSFEKKKIVFKTFKTISFALRFLNCGLCFISSSLIDTGKVLKSNFNELLHFAGITFFITDCHFHIRSVLHFNIFQNIKSRYVFVYILLRFSSKTETFRSFLSLSP